MTNLAVIIAVPDYIRADPLPGCAKDGEAVAELIQSSGRFDTSVINGNKDAGAVKAELVDLINSKKGQKIDQFFFYFTGHGDLVGDEFYFLLRDYDSKKIKQTSLENSELDNLVRSLQPELFIKVVDACHSGVSYIKSTDDLKEYIKARKDRFKSIYFMFSSLADQKSYADNDLSDFTRSFIKSVVRQSGPTIRYKDIIDFISDSFESSSSQTPFFVVQAAYTEIFCDASPGVASSISRFSSSPSLGESPEKTDEKAERNAPSLVKTIEEDAKKYCSEAETIEVLPHESPHFF